MEEEKTKKEDATKNEKEVSQKNEKDLKIEELEKQILYLRAEFENYKKRLLKENEQHIKYANEKLIKEILQVVDLLDKAISSANNANSSSLKDVILGIEMTQKVLIETLERFGVKLFGKEGEKFDPEIHEAVSQVEVSENENIIIAVIKKGCILNDRLVQAAKVVIGKKKSH